MAEKFVLLEIVDPEISGLINGIREVLMPGGFRTSVHLTLRGPYASNERIENSDVERWNSLLRTAPITLDGIGVFHNEGRHILFIKVHHENLKKIWWKPDFPVGEYGFNPHITLYSGRERMLVEKVAEFLKEEKLSLLSTRFKLATHASKQEDLFHVPDMAFRPPLELINRGKVSVTFFMRLERVVRKCRNTGQLSFLYS